jgi:3-oxoacyl-[acyl-carrier protein] reductase
MIEAGTGRIVNIASTEAIVTTAGLAAYAATKAGVIGLTKSFAVELGRHGINVNCVCPGPINTGMTADIDDESKATYARRRVPLRRYGAPEEVAHMTLNLCLPASSFVNGAAIPVDGGMSIRHT